jgi:hypothetical protein
MLFGILVFISGWMGMLENVRSDHKESGWVQLFNGRDLSGWKIHPEPNKKGIAEVLPNKEKFVSQVYTRRPLRLRGNWQTVEEERLVGYDGKLPNGQVVPLWRVEKGILIGSGPASHLFSERGDYENFHYRIEAMINDKGNSGQYFRTKLAGGFPPGYEAQINATHGDIIRTGSLYPAGGLAKFRKDITILNDAPHKPNEWFTQEVIIKGSHITIIVNGKKTLDWTDPTQAYAKGHFALQGHDPGTVVKFRKIEVKEIK